MGNPSFFRALLTLVLLVLVGCRERNLSRSPAAMIDLVPADAAYVLSSADLLSTARAIDDYISAATPKSGPLAASLRATAKDELGFDPLTAEGYQSVGIDPAPGFAAFSAGVAADPIVVVRLSDREKFLTWLKGLMRRIEGVSSEEETTIDGVSILRLGSRFGTQEVAVASAHIEQGIAWLTTPDSEARLVAWVKQRQAPAGIAAWVDDSRYQEVNRLISEHSPLRFFAHRSALAAIGTVDGIALGWTLNGQGMSADIFLKTDPRRFRAMLGDTRAHELAKHVGSDAVVVSMSGAARPEALELLREIPMLRSHVDESLTVFAAETGLDLESDVLNLSAGPTTSALYLNDLSRSGLTAQLDRAMFQGLTDGIDASFSAKLKDPEAAITGLDQAARRLRKSGRTVRRSDAKRRGKPIVRYALDQDPPRLAWAVYDGSFFYGAGAGRLDKLLDVADGKLESFSFDATAAGAWSKEPGNAIVVLRLGRVADEFERLSRALSGFSGGVMVHSVVSILQRVGDLVLSTDTPDGGLRLRYRQSFKK